MVAGEWWWWWRRTKSSSPQTLQRYFVLCFCNLSLSLSLSCCESCRLHEHFCKVCVWVLHLEHLPKVFRDSPLWAGHRELPASRFCAVTSVEWCSVVAICGRELISCVLVLHVDPWPLLSWAKAFHFVLVLVLLLQAWVSELQWWSRVMFQQLISFWVWGL